VDDADAPSRASAIAMRDSVTVSIGELTMGMRSRMFPTSVVLTSTWSGSTSEWLGSSSTSSKLSASVSTCIQNASCGVQLYLISVRRN
jgi:hypothetical protein